MQLEGKVHLPSETEKVWAFVSDPTKIITCVPGLQNFTVDENRRITASVKVAIGFIRGTFQATSKIVKEDAATHTATLELSGSGAGSGFNATVDLGLAAAGQECDMNWKADVKINGPLGSLAKPLVEGNIKKIVTEMFDCVKSKLS